MPRRCVHLLICEGLVCVVKYSSDSFIARLELEYFIYVYMHVLRIGLEDIGEYLSHVLSLTESHLLNLYFLPWHC